VGTSSESSNTLGSVAFGGATEFDGSSGMDRPRKFSREEDSGRLDEGRGWTNTHLLLLLANLMIPTNSDLVSASILQERIPQC
jgi:hypothetical protein